MKFYSCLYILLSLFVFEGAFGQTGDGDVKILIKQGVELNDQGKYTEAIAKYNEALKIDPQSLQADFEMGYTLFASGKGKQGIPYLQKVISTPNSMAAGAYDLLESIYDDDKQYDKAIELYIEGIKHNPEYQRLYYNLAISYYRQKKFTESETYATEAVKLDAKHASSQRVYALSYYNDYQNKRIYALMAFCNFLLLEPQSARSAEAFNFIKNIMHAGISRDGDKMNVGVAMPKDGDADLNAINLMLSMVMSSSMMENKKGLTAIDQLQEQLKSVFSVAGELSEKRKNKDFFWNFYVDFFYKLAKSKYMPVFTHIISLSDYPENAQWLKDNSQQLTDLQSWMKETTRSF